jgi:hypothetical protein
VVEVVCVLGEVVDVVTMDLVPADIVEVGFRGTHGLVLDDRHFHNSSEASFGVIPITFMFIVSSRVLVPETTSVGMQVTIW